MERKALIQNRQDKLIKNFGKEYAKSIEFLAQSCDIILEKENKIFCIDKENVEFIKNIFWYFSNNKKFETGEQLLSKGVLLIGNVGSGKTMIMEQISKNLTGVNAYRCVECTPFADEWKLKDSSIVVGTKTALIQNGALNNYYFDDLGDEEPISNYGPIVEVMEKVITYRNRLWHKVGTKTHISTNLSIDQIEERYGERVKSRLLHMCNVVYLGKESDSKDRRHTWN